jgi:Ger(x)C family germination protein
MRKLKSVLPILISIPLLVGCWDRIEINDLAFVIASGIDMKGIDKYNVSVQVALPSAMGGTGSSGGGGGTSGGPYYVDAEPGRNIRESNDNLQLRLSRNLYFAHRRVLIIGEKLAREGINEALNVVLTQPQSRLSTFVLISKGEAINILKTKTKLDLLPGEALREMSKSNIGMTVKDALQDMNRYGKEAVIPVVEKGKGGFKMASFAIMRHDKVAFFTNKKESGGVLWLRNKMNEKSITFSDAKKQEITLRIIESGVKPEFSMVNGKPLFTFKVIATGTLMENEGNMDLARPRIYSRVVNEFQQEVRSEIMSLIKHSHSEGIDVAGLGWYLYRSRNNLWDERFKENWEENLHNLDVKVVVDGEILRMTNTGWNY